MTARVLVVASKDGDPRQVLFTEPGTTMWRHVSGGKACEAEALEPGRRCRAKCYSCCHPAADVVSQLIGIDLATGDWTLSLVPALSAKNAGHVCFVGPQGSGLAEAARLLPSCAEFLHGLPQDYTMLTTTKSKKRYVDKRRLLVRAPMLHPSLLCCTYDCPRCFHAAARKDADKEDLSWRSGNHCCCRRNNSRHLQQQQEPLRRERLQHQQRIKTRMMMRRSPQKRDEQESTMTTGTGSAYSQAPCQLSSPPGWAKGSCRRILRTMTTMRDDRVMCATWISRGPSRIRL